MSPHLVNKRIIDSHDPSMRINSERRRRSSCLQPEGDPVTAGVLTVNLRHEGAEGFRRHDIPVPLDVHDRWQVEARRRL